jgi:hypothetical protein
MATSTTAMPSPAIDVLAVASRWLTQLDEAGQSAEPEQFSALFLPTGWLRGMWPWHVRDCLGLNVT